MVAIKGKRPFEGIADTNKGKELTKSRNDVKKLAGNDSINSKNDTSIIFSKPREDELDANAVKRMKSDLITKL